MKEYDLLAIGTGSALQVVNGMIAENPGVKIAVIDKDEPGGICLTKGCIPSKLLIYPADLVRIVEETAKFGIEVEVKRIDFKRIMDRMQASISKDINAIRGGLEEDENIDYYHDVAEFVEPSTLRVGADVLRAPIILLSTGSKPTVPAIKGLAELGYHTSDTLLGMTKVPESIAIVGGGYIAAEYGHFFSAMGAQVTIIGRNPQFLPDEEPEVSALAQREVAKHMSLLTNHEVIEVQDAGKEKKKILAENRAKLGKVELLAEEILVATGRGPNTDILRPEKGKIRTDSRGWIVVDEYLQTSQPNIWALGDANGKYPFKHKANYEAFIVYNNAILREKVKADYHAIPHAVFTHPEIASVGMKEREAIETWGEKNVLIGFKRFQDTAKGEAMAVEDYFVKVILDQRGTRILGAHIIGPHASILIQELVTLMYTPSQSGLPIMYGMHIHPALSEVVERAFHPLMSPSQYHHLLEEHLHLGRNRVEKE